MPSQFPKSTPEANLYHIIGNGSNAKPVAFFIPTHGVPLPLIHFFMQYRPFGNTDLMVSEIGFGAWAIGGPAEVGGVQIGWGPTDDAVSRRALRQAMDAGINFFDSADFYGLGHSETLIGEEIGSRGDCIIATKVGQKIGADGRIEIDYSKNYILAACEDSLRRLKREVIDYYQLHVARVNHLEQGECIEAMELLQQQGKIRYWGHSLITFAPEPEAELLMQAGKGHGFQLVLNLLNQLALPIMQAASVKGYGIIVRMPLQFGLLSGKMKPTDTFSTEDHRFKRLTPAIIEQTNDILRNEIVPMAKQYGTNVAGLALSFILGFPEVSTVIPGIRTPEQVGRNTDFLVKLSAADHQYLQGLYHSKWKPVLELIRQQG